MNVQDATPVLEVRNLTKHFPIRRGLLRWEVGRVEAVSDVSFSICAGETLAVVGESGCGKSTIGRALLRLIEPTSGEVFLDGQRISGLTSGALRQARRQMQIIFQDPYGSLNPRMTVREVLGEPLLLHGMATRANLDEKVTEVLHLCGLSKFHAERYPHEFSGGQRQRVGIARALATRPRLVVCDEPVSALDVSVQAQIVNLLQDLQAQLGMAYVFISHDLAVVRHIATRVAVMYLGRVVEEARTTDLFAEPRHPYTRLLIDAAPRPDAKARPEHRPVEGDMPSAMAPPAGCPFGPRCPMAVDRCSVERPVLRQAGRSKVACHRADEIAGWTPRGASSTVNETLTRRLAVLGAAQTKRRTSI